MHDSFFLIIGIFLSVFGLLSILSGFYANKNCIATVDAKITGLKDKASYYRGITTHNFTLEIRYTFNGKVYESKMKQSTRDARKYHIGKTLQVLVNPKQPESVLLKKTVFPFVFGLIVLIPGAILVWCYFL